MPDDIDIKLAGIDRRVKAQASAVRDELERVGLLQLAEEIRETFHGKLTWLKTDRIEIGADLPRGCRWTPYTKPKVRK